MAKLRRTILLIHLAVVTLLVGTLALGVGAVAIPWIEVLGILRRYLAGGPLETAGPHAVIITQWRLPRVILGAVVGGSLALAGACFQGLFRNPMADPYIVGSSAGAALGAVAAMTFRWGWGIWGLGPVPVFAFLGALLSVSTVYLLARRGGRIAVVPLLLAGVAVSFFLSSIVSFLMIWNTRQLKPVVSWLMGGLGAADWARVKAATGYGVVGAVVLLWHARDLDALALGEEEAAHLGVDVERTKRLLLLAGSLMTAAAVATSGLIGFVGLMVPHLVRLVVGPGHRLLLPASAMAGASMLMAADALARRVLVPAELPVGVVTSFLGGPFFIYLLTRRGWR